MPPAVNPADQADLQLRRGRALIDIARYQDAIPLLTDAVRLNPHSADPYCYLGLALLYTGDYEESLKALDESIRLNPNSEFPHRLQSMTYRRQGHHTAAVEKAQEALRLAPDSWQTLLNLAEALMSAGQRLKADKVGRRLKQLAPGESATFTMLGRTALAYGLLLRAEMHFREALRLNPQSAIVHNNLGAVLLHQERVKEAMLHFDIALTIDPTCKNSQSNVYLAARKLRGRVWLSTSQNLLLRISPRVYNYYLHMEQGSSRVFFLVFLCKAAIPLTACLALLSLGMRWRTGESHMPIIGGIGAGIAILLFILARRGWAKEYFAVSSGTVQTITTVSAWVLNPLTACGAGGLGLMLAPTGEGLPWVLVIVVGATLLYWQVVARGRGLFYRITSKSYQSTLRCNAWCNQFNARVNHFLAERSTVRLLRRLIWDPLFGYIQRVARHPGVVRLWKQLLVALNADDPFESAVSGRSTDKRK
jgi:tetratricopeptide (TPR) repeat protein